jgi:hypothetical protein
VILPWCLVKWGAWDCSPAGKQSLPDTLLVFFLCHSEHGHRVAVVGGHLNPVALGGGVGSQQTGFRQQALRFQVLPTQP